MSSKWNKVVLLTLVLGLGGLFWDGTTAILTLAAESAPYLLLGFGLAGCLKALIPESCVFQYLGADTFTSVALAALFGIPIPLCSCSVLPVAMTLRQSGASKGATTAFLISTPETGLDSIGMTYALLDPIMTIARPVSALMTAVLTGSLVNAMERLGVAGEAGSSSLDPAVSAHDHGLDETLGDTTGVARIQHVIRQSLTYAFGPLMDDLTPWLIIGFLVSGVVILAVPDHFFRLYVPSGWVPYLLMLLIGTPVYICAAAATPVAVALIAKGLDPGAALVLLLVGPATNATTMIVIARLLGKRILVAHLIGVTGCAVALGAALSGLYRLLGMDLSRVAADVVERGLSPVAVVAAVILSFFLARSAIRLQLLGQWGQRLRRLGAPLGVDPFAPAIQIAFLMVMGLAYLSTAFSVIGPGEVGWVLRFGRVVRTVSEPRLLMHFPLPFDRVKRLRPQAVRRVELGLAQQPGDMLEKIPWAADRGMTSDGLQWMSMRQDLAAEAEVITGDENIISIQYAVHYDIREPYVYQYRFVDPEEVVRALAAWVLRQAVARHAATDILVAQRVALEREILDLLQDELDTIGIGVRIIAVTLQDVHAAPPVHAAFRDVASALEDKARKTRQAQGYRSETLTLARAEAFRLMQDAASYQSDISNTARGQASAFLSRLEAYRTHPALTRLRLYFETIEAALSKARMTFLLGDDVKVELWKRRDGIKADAEKVPDTVSPTRRRNVPVLPSQP